MNKVTLDLGGELKVGDRISIDVDELLASDDGYQLEDTVDMYGNHFIITYIREGGTYPIDVCHQDDDSVETSIRFSEVTSEYSKKVSVGWRE